MSVLMRRENTLIIEPGSDISKIQIINFILLPNSKKHFEGPPLQSGYEINISTCINTVQQLTNLQTNLNYNVNDLNNQINSLQQSVAQDLAELENNTSLMFDQLIQTFDKNILSKYKCTRNEISCFTE
ncbi:Hypothetical_protein [Hexamita inflata]|uniref:Hypothetical_protein n=1 Tax=Hexamita inflata TaxID=28002 RepID=A0AA86QY50_9EUKA|nr:Hypothetical protein HINF_LOCUS54425 [Hexamita inflata]